MFYIYILCWLLTQDASNLGPVLGKIVTMFGREQVVSELMSEENKFAGTIEQEDGIDLDIIENWLSNLTEYKHE